MSLKKKSKKTLWYKHGIWLQQGIGLALLASSKSFPQINCLVIHNLKSFVGWISLFYLDLIMLAKPPQYRKICLKTMHSEGIIEYMKIMTILSTRYCFHINAVAAAKSHQSCLTLCDPIDGSPPGSPVPGILQARTLEWVAISFFKAWKWKVKVKLLSCVWLSDPVDRSPPGSSVPGIL